MAMEQSMYAKRMMEREFNPHSVDTSCTFLQSDYLHARSIIGQ